MIAVFVADFGVNFRVFGVVVVEDFLNAILAIAVGFWVIPMLSKQLTCGGYRSAGSFFGGIASPLV